MRLLGYLSYERYLQEIQSVHILLVPSVTAADGDSDGGAPTVLLEAQASGLPIVTTTHADIPYVVQAGESALLVPERNAQALADSFSYLIEHPDIREKMSQAGHHWIEKRHDICIEAQRLEEKYHALVR